MSLNVIGLVSGGKDSLYSLAHCVQNGHKIVALANLHPPGANPFSTGKENEDLNSFMYQTVGYSAIPLYANALNLPLYRRAISGAAVQKGKDYEVTGAQAQKDSQVDETEDMYLLLKDILEKHPDANALSAGAILSTYQRTRVESVSTRLGLTPLAYLWQYPALPPPTSRKDSLSGLLDDMSTAGCDARIIKLASGGIRSDLMFANVASQTCKSRLLTGLSRFYTEPGQEFELRGAILGEGGEYETLALDGPSNLWEKRIDTNLEEIYEVDGVIYAQFTGPVTVKKDSGPQNEIPVPVLLDERFNAVLRTLDQIPVISEGVPSLSGSKSPSVAIQISPHKLQAGDTVQMCNLTGLGSTAGEQLANILDDLLHAPLSQKMQDPVFKHKNIFHHISSTTLVLDNMDAFAEVNQIYSDRLWPSNRAIPPARVTIASFLPPDVHITLSLVIDINTNANSYHQGARDGLHVQSRSYWAPANIGPYSQAVSTSLALSNSSPQVDDPLAKARIVHMAGQIPLYPFSMQLSEATFAEQAALALQHLWRVGQERNVDLWLGAGVAYLSTRPQHIDMSAEPDAKSRVREAAAIWHLAHALDEKGKERWLPDDGSEHEGSADEEQEDIDVWHLQQNRGLASRATIGEHLHVLPNYDVFSTVDILESNQNEHGPLSGEQVGRSSYVPIFIGAEVAGLPRNASIEWWSTGISGLIQSNAHKSLNMYTFHKTVSKGCQATGIVIRHTEIDDSGSDINIDGLREHSSSRRKDTFTFFGALSIDLHADRAQVVEAIQNPAQTLLQTLHPEISSARREVNASHSFLSLSALETVQDLIVGSQIVEKSTIVPCKHVWASDYNGGPRESSTVPEIREVALAMVLRLDIR